MSKSSGEFLTVSLLEEKGYDPLAYRLFCLQSHYRKALVFTWENLDNAVVTFGKLTAKISALNPADGEVDAAAFDAMKARFMEALGNDLNTSLALTCVYDALKYGTNDATKLAVIADYDKVLSLDLIRKADAKRAADQKAAVSAAGSEYAVIAEDGVPDTEIETKILARRSAKKFKNFAEADRIRDELKALGVEITDIPNGVRWKKSDSSNKKFPPVAGIFR